ncbi:MAG: autotransporter outer membrane beta-barrel domain-containing protein, partial [Desulfovibrio sp.]|nr:autotransporter outer membrane beta-barrel domain-containing protein [Desulfovibrio sp.]
FNEVRQDVPRAMQMNDLKSDITARAVSAGLRGEYKISTDALDIVPHVGFRHMNLTTDDHDVASGGGTVLEGDSLSRNIWTFPVGLSFSRNLETGNGWFFRSGLDLAVIPAAGDIETKSSARFTGTGTKVELESRIMDYVSYTGGIGLDFGNGDVSFGLNYNLMFSEHTTGNGVFGTFRYEF